MKASERNILADLPKKILILAPSIHSIDLILDIFDQRKDKIAFPLKIIRMGRSTLRDDLNKKFNIPGWNADKDAYDKATRTKMTQTALGGADIVLAT